MIPLSVNGAGWREASYILLFQSVGAEAHQAAALSLLWLAVIVITSLPGGIIYLAQGRRAKKSQAEGDVIGEKRGVGASIKPAREEEPISTT